jgi:hypothetical protein
MDQVREAARQALAHVQEFKRRWMAVPPFGNKVNKATREAVTLAHVPVFQLEEALRAALEQPARPLCKGIPRRGCNYLAPCDTVCNKCGEIHHHHQMVAHFEAAQQPEQEPVAWRYDQATYMPGDVRGRQWKFNVFAQHKPYMNNMVQNVTPLYTSPTTTQPEPK